jgi:GT2 family glycosyltransferase
VGFCEYVAGCRSLDELCQHIALAASASVTADDARALAVQSDRLRAQLNARTRDRRASRRGAAPVPPLKAPGGIELSRRGETTPPNVSVVLPTRYDSEALPRTIESFLTARSIRTQLEFVIIDDDSPAGVDGTALDHLVGIQRRNAAITVVQPGKRLGITAARNLGAQWATGDWLFIADAHVEVARGWDANVREYARVGRILAATIVSDDTGARGFGASLELPSLTIRWNTEQPGDLAPVQVASSAGMVVDRELYYSLGGFDPGMLCYGPHEAEFSLRAWLRGAEVLNLPGLEVRHRFRGPAEREATLRANLELALHNRLRFALLYLPSDLVLTMVRDMTIDYPAEAVAQACVLVASSDVWRRRSLLRKKELFSFGWFSRKFALETPDGQPATPAG